MDVWNMLDGYVKRLSGASSYKIGASYNRFYYGLKKKCNVIFHKADRHTKFGQSPLKSPHLWLSAALRFKTTDWSSSYPASLGSESWRDEEGNPQPDRDPARGPLTHASLKAFSLFFPVLSFNHEAAPFAHRLPFDSCLFCAAPTAGKSCAGIIQDIKAAECFKCCVSFSETCTAHLWLWPGGASDAAPVFLLWKLQYEKVGQGVTAVGCVCVLLLFCGFAAFG